VVTARSYSRNSGITFEETEIGTSRASSPASRSISSSCAGFAYEFISETVKASTPASRSDSIAARAAAPSSSRTTAPCASIRSGISRIAA
jgi:hypothetical protein